MQACLRMTLGMTTPLAASAAFRRLRSFSTVWEDDAIDIADSGTSGITKVPWGSRRIDRSSRYFWDNMDPEKTAFYRLKSRRNNPADPWMEDLANIVAGRNGVYYANTGWNMNSPAAVRRVEEAFSMLGIQDLLETCIGIPIERFANPVSYSKGDGA